MPTVTSAAPLLARPQWQARQAAHEQRVDAWLDEHLTRRQKGVKHPVADFLFTYYSQRPAQLRRWHPGQGVVLAGGSVDRHYVEAPGGVTLDPSLLGQRRESVVWIRDLLAATASREPHFGCFGLHEWAMVYRQTQQELRHNAWPLRLSAQETARVVEERGVKCSHFDAFRFFTEPARPLNLIQPTRADQARNEQPGCLHANMDLYKWAYKLSPLVPSELVADCFALSREIRTLDMRASPYDLRDLGFEPVAIETAQGRTEYVRFQREFAERAAVLRAELLEHCQALSAVRS